MELGQIFYSAKAKSGTRTDFDYPFDGHHDFKPSIGVEFGLNNFFLYGKTLASMPLYSGGGFLELGCGGRSAKGYGHRVYYSRTLVNDINLGYQGEIRIKDATALIVGLKLGGNDNRNMYTFMLGFKTHL